MICFPNAKINIGLFVTEKRNDGYHNLSSLFVPIGIKDALEIKTSDTLNMQTYGLSIAGNPSQNLVWKAWQLLKAEFPQKVDPVEIHLIKSIPMGAGMGGGSADGAFMLQLLNDYFELKLSPSTLAEYALQLGSDCPFFIINKPCLAKGRGELLQPIALDLSAYNIQLVCPKVHITTATAFTNIQPKAASYNLENIANLKITEWKHHIFNDFEPDIFAAHPQLADIKQQLYDQGALYAAMSGTGSTIYGIFEKGKKAVIQTELEFDTFETSAI